MIVFRTSSRSGTPSLPVKKDHDENTRVSEADWLTGPTGDPKAASQMIYRLNPGTIHGGRNEIRVLVSRKRGLRNITIRVTCTGELKVQAPAGVTDRRIVEALSDKRRWIERRFDRVNEHLEFIDAAKWIMYEGVRYRVEGNREPRNTTVLFDRSAETCIVSTGADDDASAVLRDRLTGEAVPVIEELVQSLAQRVGIGVHRTYIRNQKTRWGSSSSRGNLSINWRIIMAGAEEREYLILHELAHQRHMNHSVEFWRLVATWCPDYSRHNAWFTHHSYLLSVLR